MEERLLSIVKAMARGPICYDDNCNSMCMHCDSFEDDTSVSGFSEIRHKPECPVLLARTILKEYGTPMNIYKVTYQYVSVITPKRHYMRTIKNYTIALTLEDAIKEYIHEDNHNVQAEFVHEAPMQREC